MSARILGIDLAPRKLALVVLFALAALIVSQLPPPAGTPNAMTGLAIVAFTVALWATAALPALHSGAIFFALALATNIAPTIPLLSGFWSNAAALVFGGLMIGGAAERTGLGRYVARALMSGVATYPRFIAGVLIGSGALSFIVPTTMGRLAITLPILMAAAKEAGYAPGSRGYIGIILTAVAGNYLTSYAILPANLTNIIALGALEGMGVPTLQYGPYLLMCLPILGIVKGLLFWAAVCLLLPAPPPQVDTATEESPNALSPAARRLAVLLSITVLLWMLDFVHHIKPGWIALAAGLVCLIPGLALARLEDAVDLNKLTSVFSLAAVLGVATVLTHSGAGTMIAQGLTQLVPASGATPVYGFMLITVAASVIATFATVVGAIAIVTPTLPAIEAASGLPMTAGIIAELTGLQALFFPFEAVPVMVGLMMGKVAAPSTLRILILLAVTGLIVIAPLQIAWLKILGVMP
ncbi:SLC13 family permease [Hyphomicrobium sp. CS1BSMeth3]|uniref:SLC13 family permease n=1 Tax=Hyphomicrobium sp. CS1BSMeth3 TaxID=1892844 RepID=UPI000931E410|nr:SLC13 family permease [Hyphomicrobium sp. CS1BSMeth3]